MELISVLLVALLYYFELYAFALIAIVYTAINGLLGVWYSLKNPNWYISKRLEAGVDVDGANLAKHLRSLVITKLIFTPILLFLAWHIAEKAGYL